jgi:flagellar hook assembly protein FlgD
MSAINAADLAGGRENGFSTLSTGDFTQIILTELTKQDPLAPNDTNQLLQQLATIRSIQSDTDLSNQLGKIAEESNFASAASMVGRVVTGLSTDAERVTGEVIGVTRTQAGIVLALDNGLDIPMAWVDGVVDAQVWRDHNEQNGGG